MTHNIIMYDMTIVIYIKDSMHINSTLIAMLLLFYMFSNKAGNVNVGSQTDKFLIQTESLIVIHIPRPQ